MTHWNTGNKYRQTHGMHNTPTYRSWRAMKARCNLESYVRFADYGGRGITYTPSWETFEGFYADMGERPEGTTLDRIDCDGHYTPSNCRWADGSTQAKNRRHFERVTFMGFTGTMPEQAARFGRSRKTVYKRIKKQGWCLTKALLTPPMPLAERARLAVAA